MQGGSVPGTEGSRPFRGVHEHEHVNVHVYVYVYVRTRQALRAVISPALPVGALPKLVMVTPMPLASVVSS